MAPPAFPDGPGFGCLDRRRARALVEDDRTIGLAPPGGWGLNAAVELAQEDSGRQIMVDAGQELVIALVENPTTGYRWQAEFDDAVLQESGDRFVPASAPPSTRRGAPGTRYVSFRARQAGESRLLLVNRRSWESGTGIDEFVVDVIVTDG